MCEKSSFFSEELFKNICVSFSLAYWMNYTFLIGWEKYNSGRLAKAKIMLDNAGLMRLKAAMYKEIFSLGPLSIFIKGLLFQISFVLKAAKALSPLIILLAVIYFFYFRKK